MTLLSATVYADESGLHVSLNDQLINTKKALELAAASTNTATEVRTKPTETKTQTTGVPAPAAGTQTPTTGAHPSATEPANTAQPLPAKKPQALDCTYRIPSSTTRIEQSTVQKWAEKAAEQSFDLDYKTIDKQIAKLKACYTDQGWQGFNDALEKSGNLNAIRSQQLVVSPMINGESKVTEIKDNQWKITIPLQVIYQNDKEKLTQPLTVDLLVGRKVSGDLGIMQMIAIPRQSGSTPATPTAPKQ
ncbi:MAG: DotI/IcmL/TraM family protein [Tatlockia sp.]|nr:DotI/IcmL/TraM family protein [Tatlockia sp.]